jgi:hypothetical protein
MNPRRITLKYMGWCPRFREDAVFLSPIFSLSLTGKLVVSMILVSWASWSAIRGIQDVSEYVIRNDLSTEMAVRDYGLSITLAAAGIISAMLILAYLTSTEISRRQRQLFTATLATLTAHQVIYTAFDALYFPDVALLSSLPLAYQLNFILRLVDEVLVLSVLAYALLKSIGNKPILDGNLFALLAAYFLFSAISTDAYALYISRVMYPNVQPSIMYWIKVIASNIYYGVASGYSLSTHRGLHEGSARVITPSTPLRAAFLAYGLSGLAYEAWWLMTVPDYLLRLFEPGLWAYGVYASKMTYYLAFTALTFVAVRYSIGEKR